MIRFFGLTDVGRKRTQNEDTFLVSQEGQYAILADGMGGRMYGEVASSMAVEILARHLDEDLPRSIVRLDRQEQAVVAVNLLDEWIRLVNQAIHAKGREDDRFHEMGTTLVVFLALDHQVVLGHVGDSRCYRFKDGTITRLTEDHSYVNTQVKSGVMTEEEARDSNQRNIITRAVGTASQVKADFNICQVRAGERYLMCSDGLTDMMSDEELVSILERRKSLEESAEALVSAANAAGGRDNITVVLAEQAS